MNFILLSICLFALISIIAASPQARASHILVKTEDEIDSIWKDIQGQSDQNKAFAEMAKQKSTCPSGKSGGDLGSFGRGMMVSEFDAVVFEKPINTIHKVKTQFGYHLVLTTERSGMDDQDNSEL